MSFPVSDLPVSRTGEPSLLTTSRHNDFESIGRPAGPPWPSTTTRDGAAISCNDSPILPSPGQARGTRKTTTRRKRTETHECPASPRHRCRPSRQRITGECGQANELCGLEFVCPHSSAQFRGHGRTRSISPNETLSDTSDPARPPWQLTRPARVWSNDLVGPRRRTTKMMESDEPTSGALLPCLAIPRVHISSAILVGGHHVGSPTARPVVIPLCNGFLGDAVSIAFMRQHLLTRSPSWRSL